MGITIIFTSVQSTGSACMSLSLVKQNRIEMEQRPSFMFLVVFSNILARMEGANIPFDIRSSQLCNSACSAQIVMSIYGIQNFP